MFGNRFSSSTNCSGWLHETKIGRLDQAFSCRFLKVTTHPFWLQEFRGSNRTLESRRSLVGMGLICLNTIRNVSLDAKRIILVTCVMEIRNVAHKGLRRFIEDDNPAALQPSVVPKLRRILSFLQDMEWEEELRTVPSWKAHQLGGDRKGVWSLSVTKNWRITFWIDQAEMEIVDLDYEDYH